MKQRLFYDTMIQDLLTLLKKSPMTAALRRLALDTDIHFTKQGTPLYEVRELVKSSQEPWSEVMYQSLYLEPDAKPEDRIVLQKPAVEDPSVGVLVLKAARLRGCSGVVYCGTPEQLELFEAKLPEYEKRGAEAELVDGDFIECLCEVAEEDGLKIIFMRIAENEQL